MCQDKNKSQHSHKPHETAQSKKHNSNNSLCSNNEFLNIGGKRVEIIKRNLCPQFIPSKKIFLTSIRFKICPSCHCDLQTDYIAFVPISSSKCVRYKLDKCRTCGSFYSDQEEFIQALAAKCKDQTALTINRQFFHNIEYKQTSCKAEFPTSAFCRFALTAESGIVIFTIVYDIQEDDAQNNVYHYRRQIARELLTANMYNRNRICIFNIEYEILSCELLNSENYAKRVFSPNESVMVKRKNNGGFYSADPSCITIDGLMIGERTNRLEVIPMTYDTSTKEYYVDPYNISVFEQKYGFPKVKLDVPHDDNGRKRAESLLHYLGYEANTKSCKTSAERHALLARIVEMRYLTVSEIVNHLKMLIHQNGIRCPIAKIKWEDDLEFITSYKVKSTSFEYVKYII